MTTTTDTEADHAMDSPHSSDSSDSPAPPEAGEPPRRGMPTRFGLPLLLFVLAVALTVTGGGLLVRAHSLRDDAPSVNRAVVDKKATATVIGQVSTALNSVLSYDYRKPQVAQAAARRWLTGDAPAQYKVLFGQLQRLAPGQQLTLIAKVSTAGVTSLEGGTARLLVFLDQQSTRASDGQRSISAAQVQITAVRRGSGYLISELKPI
jgi:Mce-associated membrane protein